MTATKITQWASSNGQFHRQVSSFRNFISANGPFQPERDRYHLYVSYACPWAHRTLIVRQLKGLESIVSVSVLHWELKEGGWRFPKDDKECPGATVDSLYGSSHIRDLYLKAQPDYDARYTVPVLWDKKQQTIVNNESSEIIRIFYSAFDDLLAEPFKSLSYYPEPRRQEIDTMNEWIYNTINNGVYKTGFATTQEAYESNCVVLFDSLNRVEKVLSESEGLYLLGAHLTEADIRLYPTIVRFDTCYLQHFKTDLGSIRHNYPFINRWLQNLYWNNTAFHSTTNFEHIKKHYTKSHTQINPYSITPFGPSINVEPLNLTRPSHAGFVELPVVDKLKQ
ncbi:S-glutathionyl-(chloro)hydroquinone reductase [Kappamyces sp. JEL0680]|nr:S-glutathionyl-(chloro)hydroquinone reductase [Kappamyces sp. JEL0680]